MFCFNQFGGCEGAMLRPGNVHSAERWRGVLEPIVVRYERTGVRRYFRADAAFASPEVYEYLEERGFLYAIRLPSNDVLEREIQHLLKRPVGRPPRKPIVWYHDFQYQAGSWDRPRRVVAKVEWHQGELLPRVGFINWTRLSCHRFGANQVRLHLFILAYNLGNFLRRLGLPKAVKDWSLRSLQLKLIKMGGRMVRHVQRVVFQLSEVAVSRDLFATILGRIARLRLAPG